MSVPMALSDLRTEILGHGFDPNQFPAARLNQYINDGLSLIARRVAYYADEATLSAHTAPGDTVFQFPSNLARIKYFFRWGSLASQDQGIVLTEVSERDIDWSSQTQGPPLYYAVGKLGLTLYPIPDGVYNLELRYWVMPSTLSADTDIPSLPTDWHHLLWVYGCWICYEAEDDEQRGQYWQQRFNTELAEFAADQKFPSTDYPTQAKSMWDQGQGIATRGWGP